VSRACAVAQMNVPRDSPAARRACRRRLGDAVGGRVCATTTRRCGRSRWRSRRSRQRLPLGQGAARRRGGRLMIWDRKKTAEAPKTAQESQPEPYSLIGSFSGNSREQAGKYAKTLSLTVGCSRLFLAALGTRDRKRTGGSTAAVPPRKGRTGSQARQPETRRITGAPRRRGRRLRR
jgi:hypothetical protein